MFIWEGEKKEIKSDSIHVVCVYKYLMLSFVLSISFIWSAKSSADSQMIETRITQMKSMGTEEKFFTIISAGDFYLSGNTRQNSRTVDYQVAIEGIKLFIENHEGCTVQHRDYLVSLLEQIIAKKDWEFMMIFTKGEDLGKLKKELMRLVDLEHNKETTPLLRLLQAKSEGVKYIENNSDFQSMKETLNRLNNQPNIGRLAWDVFKFKLYRWLNEVEYVVPDYDTEAEIETALNSAAKFYIQTRFKYSKELAFVLYLHVTLARLNKYRKTLQEGFLLLRISVVIKLLLKDCHSSTTRDLIGILQQSVVGRSFYPRYLTHSEEALIDHAISKSKAEDSEHKDNLIEIVVLNWFGRLKDADESKVSLLQDILHREEWQRLCPDVGLVQDEKKND
jgi:hypothetical protein